MKMVFPTFIWTRPFYLSNDHYYASHTDIHLVADCKCDSSHNLRSEQLALFQTLKSLDFSNLLHIVLASNYCAILPHFYVLTVLLQPQLHVLAKILL